MTGTQSTSTTAPEDLGQHLEGHRKELRSYAYRMLGSSFDADDAVQEALVRAWRGYEGFEGRATLRSWLYRITTNVCFDMLSGKERRVRPMDLGTAGSADVPLPEPRPEIAWIEPVPDERVVPEAGDPSEVAELRESIRLAFIAALQHLPPKQRSVLILREVLRWKAHEVAQLLETSVASVNSALQRARATLEARGVPASARSDSLDETQRTLLARYVAAFERYDMDELTSLLHEDATWNMPPYDLWLQTHLDIRKFCLGPGIACRGSRLVATEANGSPAFAHYKPSEDGGYEPWSLQVVEIDGDKIAGITFFLDTPRLFPLFGFPPRLDRA